MFKPKKLRRTLLLLSLSSTLTLPAYAFLNPSANFNGFYAGIDGGGLSTQGQLSANQSVRFFRPNPATNIPTRILSIAHSASLRDDSLIGDIHLGYGHALGPVYIGADIFGNLANRNLQTSYINSMSEIGQSGDFSTNVNQNIKAHLNNAEYGVDLRPGVFLSSSTLLFGDVGAAFNSIELNSNSAFTINNSITGNVTTTSLPSNVKKSVTGLRLGGGVEERIGAHWGISANYIYTDYGDINVSGVTNTNNDPTTGTASTPNGFTTQTQAKDITSQATMLGVNYYFDPAAEATTGAFFGMDPQVSTVFNGFYAGIEGGLLQDRANVNSSTSARFIFSTNTGTLTDSQSPHVAKDTGIGSVVVGYGHLLGASPLYLGVDMFANFGHQDLVANYNVNDAVLRTFAPANPLGPAKLITGSAQVDLNSVEWGGDLRPGILLGPTTLLSGIVGVAVNQLKLTANNTFQFSDLFQSSPDITISPLTASGRKNVIALRLGAGLEEYLGQHLSVNVDYIYTDYGNINVTGVANTNVVVNNDPVVVTPNGFTNQTKAKVSSQTLMAGLTYHFGGTATA